MTTAATSLLGLALPVTGELSGTWGDTVNNSITSLLDTAVAGTTTLSTDADVTLTTTTLASNQARQAILLCSGARTALRTITAPAQSKIYTIINATTGGYSVKLVGVGPTTGLTIPNGASAVVAWNGSDFIEVGSATVGNLTVNGNLTVTGSTTLSGGTANGVAYLNGSKVVTTGSALTFDGTNLGLSGTGARYINLGTTSTNGQTAALQISAPNSDASASVYRIGSGLTADNEWTVYDVTNTQTVDKYIRGSSGYRAFYQNGSEQMRLTSTGLGIGTTSPGYKLDVTDNSTGQQGRFNSSSSNGTSIAFTNSATNGRTYRVGTNYVAGNGEFSIYDSTAGAERLQISSSGNLGLGVTPSAWSGGFYAFEMGAGSLSGYSTSQFYLSSNCYRSGSNWIYKTTSQAAQYAHYQGQHVWYTAASGTAGDAINFGDAKMTLDASGNLLIGTTSAKSKLVVEGGQISVGSTGAGGNGIYLYINNALSDNSYLSRASAGTGTTTWYIGNQSITTSSDQRLKADIKPSERNAIDLLNQWEIVDHTWNDPSDQCENNRNSRGVWTGVIAQQVQSVTPWLVNKPIEDVNEDGSINPWTMDFGYAVPLLVKAIQEQQAIIETLTARITALEAK